MLLVALLLLLSSPKMLAGDQPFCSNANSVYIPNSTYMSNLRTLAETLIAKITESHLHSATGTAGTGPDKIYGAVLCRGDSTGTDCTEHLNRVLDAAINNKASNSYTSRNNITLFDDWYRPYQAQISFSDKDFLSSFSNAPECVVSANLNPPLDTVAEHNLFRKLVSELMRKLTEDAVRRLNRYSTGQGWFNEKSQPVYGLVQCTEDMPPEDCRSCLESIIPGMEQMVDDGQMGGAILGVRCNLRGRWRASQSWAEAATDRACGSRSITLPRPPAVRSGANSTAAV